MITRISRLVPLSAMGLTGVLLAQPTGTSPLTGPPNGPRSADPTWHALVGGTVHPRPGEVLANATVVLRDGRIVSVDAGAAAPAGARVWDCTGLHIYPGFIDAYVEVDAPAPDPDAPGVHWNPRVTPQRRALDGTGVDERTADSLRKLGFTAAAISPRAGVFRGSGSVVSLAKPASDSSADRPPVYRDKAYHAVGIGRVGGGGPGGGGGGGYPGSQMGVIAVIRQTLIDASWQSAARTAGVAIAPNALDALAESADALPLLFDTSDELETLRAAKIAREFKRPSILLGSGTEFRRLDAIKADGYPLIVPLAFPRAPDVSSIAKAESVELRDMMTWEQAPTNPRRLDAAGLKVALTSSKLRDRAQFTENLAKVIRHGLTADRALAMLTTQPAEMLGVADRVGTIEPGKVASLLVADGDLFTPAPAPGRAGNRPPEEAADRPAEEPGDRADERPAREGGGGGRGGREAKSPKVRDVWIDGTRHEINAAPNAALAGTWAVTEFDGKPADPQAADTPRVVIDDRNTVTVKVGDKQSRASNVQVDKSRASYTYDDKPFGGSGVVIDQVVVEGDTIVGLSQLANGALHRWQAKRLAPDAPAEQPGAHEDAKPDAAIAAIPETNGYPFGPYALDQPPAQPALLIIWGGTVWTSGPDGIIPNGEVEIQHGKLIYVGAARGDKAAAQARVSDFKDGPATFVDATGRHVTPGLIDCHSHTGISGSVNEGSQACTAEVRIEDVTNPDTVNWYRQLAGGVTAVNSLHGSANPIGGQNCFNKVRWGAVHPDEMHFEGAKPGIKFALGENVKRSNSQAPPSPTEDARYPTTRMGVEAIIRDRFQAAREYAAARTNGHNGSTPHRRDLELEALAQILAGERLVHCHSYRQDEILMLARLAQEFGFKIGTYQHNLEGYKVADAVRDSALGASLFSDWWNYKVEVQDAIPQAGPIMWEVGNVVSYNSDSDELARRMNVEAGKAVKYGGLKPEEALKFVTINPAIQLAIDNRVGSLEAGKDADLAIWSGPPLSSLSRCEAAYVDGREYFSLAQDAKAREKITSERRRLIQKLLVEGGRDRGDSESRRRDGEGRPGGRPTPPTDPREEYYRAALREHYLEMLRSGVDPESHRCGDCGSSLIELSGGR